MYTVVQFNRHVYWAMILGLLFFGNGAQAIARQPLFESFKRIIVIDPGHGGQEFGAKGPDGTLEKTVTLELARLIASELEPEFKVVLTRTDDYQVDLDNRTSLANHLKADIFISIHTGGSFAHSTTGTSIYFYQDFSKPDSVLEQPPSPTDRTRNEPIFWKNVQSSHLSKSRELARTIDDHLKVITAIQSRVEGYPLAVLQGAAMPAILIEAGYLTNPAEEKNLRDNRFLMDFAEQIRMGIEDFLSRNQQ
ncbi:MAG: N-acetylmuramoyl-L-alanine amidase [Desulfobacterales bacterium]